jgi:hypothetical protein
MYKEMPSYKMIQVLGDDAAKWAAAFLEYFPNCGVDEGTLIGWFANAIEHSSDVRRWRAEQKNVNKDV